MKKKSILQQITVCFEGFEPLRGHGVVLGGVAVVGKHGC